ncbi:MAG: heparan-alpha-glucosaminide N-acetyltransferase domain-containing protein, partial [Rhodoferax sp.]
MVSYRNECLDKVRGSALLWMAAFHFCFDLANAGLLRANFYADSFWTTQRTLILSLFLLCAGAGQAIAHHHGQTWSRFWKRWAQIAGCALLVSVGSALMFPNS